MLLRKNYILFFTFFLYVTGAYAQFFKHLDMKDGLSNLSVLSITQDTLGRMWFGTNNGLNRYDGKHMEVYRTYSTKDKKQQSTKLIIGAITHMVSDAEGNILLHDDQALLKYDVRRNCLYELQTGSFFSLAHMRNEVWCSANDSLFSIDSKTDKLKFLRKLNTPTIYCMTKKGGSIYYGTAKGLYVSHGGQPVRCVLPDVEIYQLFVSSSDELWIASRVDGLYRIGKDGKLKKEQLSADRVVSPQIREFAEDDKQNIWFGTFRGLQMYNPRTDTYCVYRPNVKPGSLSHESVFPLYKDRQGTIWVGTYYGGVNYFNQKNDALHFYPYDAFSSSGLSNSVVNEMVEDGNKRIWIGTDGGGIDVLNPENGMFTHFKAGDGSGLQQNNIKCISCDEHCEHIYVGTYTGGLYRYDVRAGKFYSYLSDPSQQKPGDVIYYTQYKDGFLYVSCKNEFWQLNTATGQFRLLAKGDNFLTFCVDNKNNIWLAAYPCLYRLALGKNVAEGNPSLEEMLKSQVQITQIIQASDGRIYLSTLGNGLMAYTEKTRQWTSITAEQNNLGSDFCYNLMETPNENLLVTTNKGFSIYSLFNGAVYSYWFDTKRGISGVTNGNGVLAASDGTIYIGGVDGLISFREKDLIKATGSESDLYFSNVYINNVEATPSDDANILEQALPFVHKLHLKYNQNNVTIEFANSNYAGQEHNLTFQYKLEGFNKEWISTDQTTLTYTNLSPGHYVLKVREAKNGKAEAGQQNEITLDIVIDKPPYASWWAIMGYILVLGFFVYFYQNVRRKRRQTEELLEKEKNEKEKIEELNKVKLRFFTNISHEFRTPLTLIVGQTELLLQKEGLSSGIASKLHSIYRNAMNLRILITELLDFRKQEQGFMTLKVQQVDMIPFLEKVYQSFSDSARSRGITYQLDYVEKDIKLWIDPIQMQRVMFNLLSNAFKYTKDGGQIKIIIRQQLHSVVISVSDNGCGIPQDMQDKVFTRFYQVESTLPRGGVGSGIGLAFTKAIVEAHKGIVSVDSVEGEGSNFKVELQKGNSHFSPAELEHETTDISTPEWKDPYEESAQSQPESEPASDAPKAHTVLVVDDDKEVRDMLLSILSPYYNVQTANNGQEGFDLACQIHPDLVISDVIMPVMSGKKLCYKIKNCIELAYVPVILLTAQASDDYAIEGFMFGADDYIGKPFNIKMLLVRCENLIKTRSLLLNQARSNPITPSVASTQNQRIQDKAIEIIKQNFSNPDFGMKELAQALNMGRTKMFTSIKEATGLTPNELMLKLKLEEAFRILQSEPDYNISEISYRLGFNSPQYFSRCFKTFYGVSPQNYRKNGNQVG